MPDYSTTSAADLRARIAAHAADRARAERKRAELAGARGEALLTLTVDEVLEFDADLARTAIAIERADANLARLRSALAAAEEREAEADARQRSTAERAVYADTRRAVLDAVGSDPERHRIASQGLMAASGPVVSQWNPALFDPKPAPVVTRVDEKAWHEARAARLAAEAGNPAPRGAPTSMDFGRPGPSAADTLFR